MGTSGHKLSQDLTESFIEVLTDCPIHRTNFKHSSGSRSGDKVKNMFAEESKLAFMTHDTSITDLLGIQFDNTIYIAICIFCLCVKKMKL